MNAVSDAVLIVVLGPIVASLTGLVTLIVTRFMDYKFRRLDVKQDEILRHVNSDKTAGLKRELALLKINLRSALRYQEPAETVATLEATIADLEVDVERRVKLDAELQSRLGTNSKEKP